MSQVSTNTFMSKGRLCAIFLAASACVAGASGALQRSYVLGQEGTEGFLQTTTIVDGARGEPAGGAVERGLSATSSLFIGGMNGTLEAIASRDAAGNYTQTNFAKLPLYPVTLVAGAVGGVVQALTSKMDAPSALKDYKANAGTQDIGTYTKQKAYDTFHPQLK